MSGSKTDYSDLLNYSVKLVEDKLKRIFADLLDEAGKVSPLVTDLPSTVSDYTLRGGKRLRAFLALIGYWSKNWGGGDPESISFVMAGIELLQSYLLVHDDIMDRDELRRGGPTVHVVFREQCKARSLLGDCAHYGASQAITAGDYLEATAVELLSSARLESATLSRLLKTYARGLRLVAYGQYLDVHCSYLPLSAVREEHVLLVHTLKTASYTVELPLHLGAIASQAYTERLFTELTRYAIPAGIAFQLRDDIIGLYGDPKTTGKPVGSDVKSKKKTLLVVKAYQLADNDSKRLLEKIYQELDESEITPEHVEFVQRLVKETGSLAYSEELIKKYVSTALSALESATEINEQARDVLRWLLYKLAYREY